MVTTINIIINYISYSKINCTWFYRHHYYINTRIIDHFNSNNYYIFSWTDLAVLYYELRGNYTRTFDASVTKQHLPDQTAPWHTKQQALVWQYNKTRDTRDRRRRRKTVEHVNNTSWRDWAQRACPPVTGPQLLSITKAPATNEWAVTKREELRTYSAHLPPKTANYHEYDKREPLPIPAEYWSARVSARSLNTRPQSALLPPHPMPPPPHHRVCDHRGVLIQPLAFYTTIVR